MTRFDRRILRNDTQNPVESEHFPAPGIRRAESRTKRRTPLVEEVARHCSHLVTHLLERPYWSPD